MPLFAKNLQELTADSLGDLSTNTNITRYTPGAKARAILDSVNKRLEEAYTTFDLNLARAFVSAAPGQYLDLIGDLLGVSRESAVGANVDEDLEVIKFYVENNQTFGSINSGGDIIVPEGTRISSRANGTGIVFRVLNTSVLVAGSIEGFVSAEAVNVGEGSNLGVGALRYHAFADYTDVASNSLLVTNLDPIANGQNLETDENYRFRISNRVLEAEAGNEMAIRLAAISTPGVADILLIPRYRGIGTFGVVVESITPTVSSLLVDNVQARVEGIKAFGEIAYVRAAREMGLVMKTTVEYQARQADTFLDEIELNLENEIRSWVSELGLGDDFVVNQLVSRLFKVSDQIRSVGVAGTPLEEVYLYSPSRLDDNRVRTRLLGNYVAEADERVIIETTVDVPIQFERSYTRG